MAVPLPDETTRAHKDPEWFKKLHKFLWPFILPHKLVAISMYILELINTYFG